MKRPAKANNILDLVAKSVLAGRLSYTGHANERMKERGIIKPEVEFVLVNGHHEAKKDQYRKEHGDWDYAIKGLTVDGRKLRIVVALETPHILVVTAIDLDK